MTKARKPLNKTLSRTIALLVLLCGLALAAAGPISAKPGWSHPGQEAPSSSFTAEQRDHIRNLHSAYRAALSELDWSIGEHGHAPETMQKARELRMALRAEIFDVLHRDSQAAKSSEKGTCPYSGRAMPVRFDTDAATLYL